jgi:hypothetical protein
VAQGCICTLQGGKHGGLRGSIATFHG